MIYLIVDTNNWIYLASSKNPDTDKFEDGRHIKLFNTLLEKIDKNEIELLLCPIIETEWKRNKAEAEALIKKYQNELVGHNGVIRKMADTLDDADKAILGELCKKYEMNIQDKIKENQEHVSKIDALIQRAKKYNISLVTKGIATDWAVEKKAPFKGDKKNSMADALIFFGAVEHIKGISKIEDPGHKDDFIYDYPISIFVSGNKGDFSNPQNNDEIHEDLKPVADSVHLNFFRSLPAALNFIQEQIEEQSPIFTAEELLEIEQDVNNISDEWYTCDVCTSSSENEYTNMVFFSAAYEVEVINDHAEDPNQIKIDFPGITSSKIEKTVDKIRTGDCSRCGTTHLLCMQCGVVTPLEGENENGFQCEGCGTSYVIKTTRDRGGVLEKEILVDLRKI